MFYIILAFNTFVFFRRTARFADVHGSNTDMTWRLQFSNMRFYHRNTTTTTATTTATTTTTTAAAAAAAAATTTTTNNNNNDNNVHLSCAHQRPERSRNTY